MELNKHEIIIQNQQLLPKKMLEEITKRRKQGYFYSIVWACIRVDDNEKYSFDIDHIPQIRSKIRTENEEGKGESNKVSSNKKR